MLALPLAVAVALVTQDATPLHAGAAELSPRQTMLYAGDWLELRGERQGWLQVYDHRHERPGYVRPAQVRTYRLPDNGVDAGLARDLAAIVDFVRDTPGQEALGIGYAALFMRAAPASAVGPELFDALGSMAQALARRASSRWARPNDAALAGAIEVAESYGVHFRSFERDGRTRVCYDGEAYRRVLALAASPAAAARAALGLTEPVCIDPALPAADRETLVAWQADVLGKADPGATQLPIYVGNKLRLRRASVQAELAYGRARRHDAAGAATAAAAATRELALVDKAELADDDGSAYDEAAVRVGAVRWAAEPVVAPLARSGRTVAVAAGEPGQTCVRVMQGASKVHEHCTYAVVWPASLAWSARGDALTLAQSPLPGWTELVVLTRAADGWTTQTLAPAATSPELGYVEAAGWSPDGTRLLLVREARVVPAATTTTLPAVSAAPALVRSFQIVRAGDWTIEKQASRLDNFVSFRRWESATWRRSTLALR